MRSWAPWHRQCSTLDVAERGWERPASGDPAARGRPRGGGWGTQTGEHSKSSALQIILFCVENT